MDIGPHDMKGVIKYIEFLEESRFQPARLAENFLNCNDLIGRKTNERIQRIKGRRIRHNRLSHGFSGVHHEPSIIRR
ncbi:hypothetical protein D3C86_1901190 [compost metagenome]